MKIQLPPPPPRAATPRLSLPLPPPPPAQRPPLMRPPPPPPRGDAFQPSNVATLSPQAGISPAFVRQVEQTATPQLKLLASQLKMELVMARFSGQPGKAADLQRKLTFVEGQLHRRDVKQELVSRFAYQRQSAGMSNGELTGARSKESQALFVAQFRGDVAGVKEASAKLAILDREIGKREHELGAFQKSLGGMSPEQLDKAGTALVAELEKALFSPGATAAQKDSAFSKLALLIGEHLKRGMASAFAGGVSDDARYSK